MSGLMCSSFSADGNLLLVPYVGETDCDFEVYRLGDFIAEGAESLPALIPAVKTIKISLSSCYWSGDGNKMHLALVYENTPTTFAIWEWPDRRALDKLNRGHLILGLRLFLCNVLVLTCNEISIHCVHKKLIQFTILTTAPNPKGIYGFGVLSMDSARPVVAYPGKRDGEFQVAQYKNYKKKYEKRKILSHDYKIEAVAICSRYNLVASTCVMGAKIRVYAIESGIKLYELFRDAQQKVFLTKALSFSANGKYLMVDSSLLSLPLLHVYCFDDYHLSNPIPTKRGPEVKFGPYKTFKCFPGLRGSRISTVSSNDYLLVASANGFIYSYYLPSAVDDQGCIKMHMRKGDSPICEIWNAPSAYEMSDFSPTAPDADLVFSTTTSVGVQTRHSTADVATSPLHFSACDVDASLLDVLPVRAGDADVALSSLDLLTRAPKTKVDQTSALDLPTTTCDADVTASSSVRAGDVDVVPMSVDLPTKTRKTKIALTSSPELQARDRDDDVAAPSFELTPSERDADVASSSLNLPTRARRAKIALTSSLELQAKDRDADVAAPSFELPPSDRDAYVTPSSFDLPTRARDAKIALPSSLDFQATTPRSLKFSRSDRCDVYVGFPIRADESPIRVEVELILSPDFSARDRIADVVPPSRRDYNAYAAASSLNFLSLCYIIEFLMDFLSRDSEADLAASILGFPVRNHDADIAALLLDFLAKLRDFDVDVSSLDSLAGDRDAAIAAFLLDYLERDGDAAIFELLFAFQVIRYEEDGVSSPIAVAVRSHDGDVDTRDRDADVASPSLDISPSDRVDGGAASSSVRFPVRAAPSSLHFPTTTHKATFALISSINFQPRDRDVDVTPRSFDFPPIDPNADIALISSLHFPAANYDAEVAQSSFAIPRRDCDADVAASLPDSRVRDRHVYITALLLEFISRDCDADGAATSLDSLTPDFDAVIAAWLYEFRTKVRDLDDAVSLLNFPIVDRDALIAGFLLDLLEREDDIFTLFFDFLLRDHDAYVPSTPIAATERSPAADVAPLSLDLQARACDADVALSLFDFPLRDCNAEFEVSSSVAVSADDVDVASSSHAPFPFIDVITFWPDAVPEEHLLIDVITFLSDTALARSCDAGVASAASHDFPARDPGVAEPPSAPTRTVDISASSSIAVVARGHDVAATSLLDSTVKAPDDYVHASSSASVPENVRLIDIVASSSVAAPLTSSATTPATSITVRAHDAEVATSSSVDNSPRAGDIDSAFSLEFSAKDPDDAGHAAVIHTSSLDCSAKSSDSD